MRIPNMLTCPERGLILVGGGVRCGKSAFALALAATRPGPHCFLATARALDAEMAARIAAHKAERGPSWTAVEAPENLPEALTALPPGAVAVVDCLTNWLANLVMRGDPEAAILARCDAFAAAAFARTGPVIAVTNEVGMGVVPPSELGRVFRDVCGRAHQRLAPHAHTVYFATLGVLLRLHPGPVEAIIWNAAPQPETARPPP